jgi:hypothetical protein
VDFKSRDLEKILDGLFTLTLQMNGATTVQRKPLTISNNDSLITTERKDRFILNNHYLVRYSPVSTRTIPCSSRICR